jgi:methylated-DNA-[protein]-cysteine S-methyltransferase
MRASAEEEVLTGLWFIGQKYYPQATDTWGESPDYPVFGLLRNWLETYFGGKNPSLLVLLNPQGTPFQQMVWTMLQNIPYGKTTAYGAIAKQISAQGSIPMSARAVGGAVGRNPISLLIPCHRVIGSGGKITGYAGGIEKKEALLKLEQGG